MQEKKEEKKKKSTMEEAGSLDKEEVKKGLSEFKEGEVVKEPGEEKEAEVEPEAPIIELEDFLKFIASLISKGLPEELKKKFIEEYVDFVNPPLTLLKYEESMGWLFKYLAVMPDWQRFLIGSGVMVGCGLYMRVSFVKEMKKLQKKTGKEKESEKKGEKG